MKIIILIYLGRNGAYLYICAKLLLLLRLEIYIVGLFKINCVYTFGNTQPKNHV